MNSSKYDLAVAYRIYPRVSGPGRNLPFGNDKLRQAEVCLRSFRDSLGSLRVKMWVILDGCPPEYQALFKRYFAVEDLSFVELDHVGNRETYARQLEILVSQEDAEVVYFAEDDYVYLPAKLELAVKFIRECPDVDFVSLYDHVDCYQLDLHREPKWMTVFADHHWRTAASTCLTFLASKRTLVRYQKVFHSFARKYGDDCALWLSLTKRRVFNPFLSLRYFIRREPYWKVLLKSWLFCWRQIIFGRTARLWIPVPGMATHLSEGLMSPATDWIGLMDDEYPARGSGFNTSPVNTTKP